MGSNSRDTHTLLLLGNLYRLQNQIAKADDIDKKILGIYSVTVINYQTLKRILKEKGIRLIAVQYPKRSIQPLKDILGKEDVVYVDNEVSFKEAVTRDGYDKYFIDKFAGDFGHGTQEGNFLLASNIAQVIKNLLTTLK